MKVLVTNATRNAGMAAIRCLARNGCEVIGLDSRKLPLNLHSRHTRPYYFYPAAEKDGSLEALITIIRKERPDVVLPISNTKLIAKHREEIEKHTSLLVPPYESFTVAHDKQTTLEECRKIGISCPALLTEKEAVAKLTKNAGRKDPVVVKPRQEIGGARGLSIVRKPEALKKAKDESERLYGENIIEEYIPGDTESMRTVNLLFNKKNRLAAYFTTKKLRQWPTTGGISALSISTNEWELVKMVLPFFEKWKWQGPAEVELKVDARDNTPKLIEINPRFWGYIGFPARCGLNFPMIACELAKNSNARYREYPKYDVGIKYIDPSAYIKAVTSDIFHSNSKAASIARIVTDLKGKKVSNYVELSDFMVIIAKILLELKSMRKTSPPEPGQ
jgi:predicted ATP-grasp superfamily ATP-dependent carboligase